MYCTLEKWVASFLAVLSVLVFFPATTTFGFTCTYGTCPDGKTTGINDYECHVSSYSNDMCGESYVRTITAWCANTPSACQACAKRGKCDGYNRDDNPNCDEIYENACAPCCPSKPSCSCGSWGSCSTDCGTGTQSRTCTPSGCDTQSRSCTVYNDIDGGWSSWSTCDSSGNQTRTCNNPEPYCNGLECLKEDGTSGLTETRPCGYISGIIWADENSSGDSTASLPSEDWAGKPLSCVDSDNVNPFVLHASADDENILTSTVGSWWCDSSVSKYSTAQQIQRGNRNITLSNLPTIPADGSFIQRNFQCSNVSWIFTNSLNQSSHGTSCTASNLPILANEFGQTNSLTWRLRSDCEVSNTYQLKVNVDLYDYEDTNSCSDSNNIIGNAPDGLGVTIHPSSGDSRTQDLSGGFTIFSSVSLPGYYNPVITTGGVLRNDSMQNGEVYETFNQVCPSNGSYTATYNAKYCEKHEVDLGVKRLYKDGWISVIDADLFAGDVAIPVPLGVGSQPAGFTKTLMNSLDNNTGGFSFSKTDIDPPSDKADAGDYGLLNQLYEIYEDSDLGGKSIQLEEGGQSHNSKWLHNVFSFNPPSTSTNLDSMPSSFNSDTVYDISASDFEDYINSSSLNYTISGSTGVAILYITDVDSEGINISNTITTSSTGRLIIVIPGSVTIDKDIGSDPTLFSISQDPHIMSGIVAQGDISFDAEDVVDDEGQDIPIMLTAPLASRTNISFSRDLGYDNNAVMPAESVMQYNRFLYLLASLEKEKSEDTLYYTGLTSYDTDWEYIY